jgi:hypothetical protein
MCFKCLIGVFLEECLYEGLEMFLIPIFFSKFTGFNGVPGSRIWIQEGKNYQTKIEKS